MTKKELTRLKEIEARTKEILREHDDVVEAGGFLRLSVVVIKESEWLIKQLKAALKGQKVDEDEEEAVAVGDPTAGL